MIRLKQKYLQSSNFSGRRVVSLVCAQSTIFFNEPVSKNGGNCTNVHFMFGGRFGVSLLGAE
jgi:hypothetical protein